MDPWPQPPPYPGLPVVLRELMLMAHLLKATAQPSASLHNHLSLATGGSAISAGILGRVSAAGLAGRRLPPTHGILPGLSLEHICSLTECLCPRGVLLQGVRWGRDSRRKAGLLGNPP